jgi:hypothetical protein
MKEAKEPTNNNNENEANGGKRTNRTTRPKTPRTAAQPHVPQTITNSRIEGTIDGQSPHVGMEHQESNSGEHASL